MERRLREEDFWGKDESYSLGIIHGTRDGSGSGYGDGAYTLKGSGSGFLDGCGLGDGYDEVKG